MPGEIDRPSKHNISYEDGGSCLNNSCKEYLECFTAPLLRERRKAVRELHEKMRKIVTTAEPDISELDSALWQTVVAYQDYLFHTTSGLPFSYKVKHKKNGEYSGELLVSRKEGSKTLTKSSVIFAFHQVLKSVTVENMLEKDGVGEIALVLPEYRGPKAIGQIFGISYVYSMFWEFGLISVPDQVRDKLKGKF